MTERMFADIDEACITRQDWQEVVIPIAEQARCAPGWSLETKDAALLGLAIQFEEIQETVEKLQKVENKNKSLMMELGRVRKQLEKLKAKN